MVLRKRLPLEVVDIIMKWVHILQMEDIKFQIRYCITWVRYNNELSFITSNNYNYYMCLTNEDSPKPSQQQIQHLDS